jgi:hypothetical protein
MWQLEEAKIFHARHQVWVHVDFQAYRRAYELAFPLESLRGLVLDHILNRRVARLPGHPGQGWASWRPGSSSSPMLRGGRGWGSIAAPSGCAARSPGIWDNSLSGQPFRSRIDPTGARTTWAGLEDGFRRNRTVSGARTDSAAEKQCSKPKNIVSAGKTMFEAFKHCSVQKQQRKTNETMYFEILT